MGINPAKLEVGSTLEETIKNLELATQDFKKAQLLGADVFDISTLTGQTNVPIPANELDGFGIGVTPEFGGLMIQNFTLEIRIDTDDANHTWPYGASLTSGQLSVGPTIIPDSGAVGAAWSTDDTTGRRTYTVSIANFDGSAHTYYCRWKLYGAVTTLVSS